MASDPCAYPDAPWRLQGQLWLSLFRVTGADRRPDGPYAAAFVSYEPGSDLTYSELLVARPADGVRIEITDIWVDSPASRTASVFAAASSRGTATISSTRTTPTASAAGTPACSPST